MICIYIYIHTICMDMYVTVLYVYANIPKVVTLNTESIRGVIKAWEALKFLEMDKEAKCGW